MYLFSTGQSWQCEINSWKEGNKFPQPQKDAMLKSLGKISFIAVIFDFRLRDIQVSCGKKSERRKWLCVLVLQRTPEFHCEMPKRRQTWRALLIPLSASGQGRKTDARVLRGTDSSPPSGHSTELNTKLPSSCGTSGFQEDTLPNPRTLNHCLFAKLNYCLCPFLPSYSSHNHPPFPTLGFLPSHLQ